MVAIIAPSTLQCLHIIRGSQLWSSAISPSFPLKWVVGSELRFLQQHCSKEEGGERGEKEVAIGRVPRMHHATYIHLSIHPFRASS